MAISDEELIEILNARLKSKESLRPTNRPSLAVRAARGTWKRSGTISLAITLVGIGAELAARAWLGQAGPWSKFFSLLAQMIEKAMS